jgi:peptide/nickel transport system permease protein
MTDVLSKEPGVSRVPTGPEVWRRHAEEHVVQQSLDESQAPRSARKRFLQRFLRQWPAVIALLFLIAIVGVAIFAPQLAPFPPDLNEPENYLAPPSDYNWLGTDHLGRDTYSRILFGARVSLIAAVQAVSIAMVLGIVPGLLAGYIGGWVDVIVMRLTETIMTFPPLLLAIAIVAVRGPGLGNAMFAVGVVFAPRFARLTRGLVLSVREETFIEAARSIGTPTFRILRKHILPNILSPLVVQISLALGFAMLAEAALSFLGLGVRPPEASWGALLQVAYSNISRDGARFQAIPPGVAIMLCVLAFNVLGDGIRDSLGKEIRRGK